MKKQLDFWIYIVIFFMILVGTISAITYYKNDDVFDAQITYINNVKMPYSIILNIQNKVPSDLKYEIEVVYKKNNLVVASEDLNCHDTCETKLELKKIFFDNYNIIIRTRYENKYYEKTMRFKLNQAQSKNQLFMNKIYYLNDTTENVTIKGSMNIETPSQVLIDIFPKLDDSIKFSSNFFCNKTCDFSIPISSPFILGEYKVNIYLETDIMATTFRLEQMQIINDTTKYKYEKIKTENKTEKVKNKDSYKIISSDIPDEIYLGQEINFKIKLNKKINKNELKLPIKAQFKLNRSLDSIASNSIYLEKQDTFELSYLIDDVNDVTKLNKILNGAKHITLQKSDEIKNIEKQNNVIVQKLKQNPNGKKDIEIKTGNITLNFKNINLENITKIETVKNKNKKHASDILHVEAKGFNETKIMLPKSGKVTEILTCNKFENENCISGWHNDNISFTQDENYVWFTVKHFSAYVANGPGYNFSVDFTDLSNVLIVQNTTQTVSVNVSCDSAGDCGGINVSLYYILKNKNYTRTTTGSGNYNTYSCSSNPTGGEDDEIRIYQLGFDFPFWNTLIDASDNAYYDTNGRVSFTDSASDYNPSAADMIGEENIAFLWGDLGTAGNNEYFCGNQGTFPNRYAVFRTDSTWLWDFTPAQAEVILYENGNIVYNYGTIGGSTTHYVGLSAGDNTNYLYQTYSGSTNQGLSFLYTYNWKKLISTTSGTKPFWTTSSNPQTISLNQNQSQLVSFTVNGSGNIGDIYEIVVIATKSDDSTIKAQSNNRNVSIADNQIPNGIKISPTNGNLSTTGNMTFTASFTDDSGLKKAILYIWNSSNSLVYSSQKDITGLSNSTSWNILLQDYGNYTWNVEVYDIGLNKNWTSGGNWSFFLNISELQVKLYNPLFNVSALQNEFFNFTVNVSCSENNCGNVNVILYYAGANDIYTRTTTGSGNYNTYSCNSNPTGGEDDAIRTYSLGFNFPFYYTTIAPAANVYYDTNGRVSFTDSLSNFAPTPADMIGDENIAFLWGDLGTATNNEYFCGNQGTSPNRYAVFRTHSTWLSDGTNAQAEVIVYESGDIVYNYGTVAGSTTHYVGLSAGDNTNYLYQVYSGGTNSGLSFLYRYNGYLSLVPINSGNPFYVNNSNTQTITNMQAGDSYLVTFVVNATGVVDNSRNFFVRAVSTDYSYLKDASDVVNIKIVDSSIEPPKISFIPPTTANNSVLEQDWFEVNVSINTSGYDDVYLETDGVNQSIKTSCYGSNPSYICHFNKSGLSGGSHNFRVYIKDLVGQINMTELRTILLNTAPTHTNPILNSTYGTNSTYENLTCYNQSTLDLDGDNVKNIFNWYKNGQPLQILNMPFEGGSNSTWTKDYSSYSHDGTVVGDVDWVSNNGHDLKGNYRFYGDNDYINLGDINELDNPSKFTVTMWFRRTSDELSATNHNINNVLLAQSSAATNDNLEIGTEGNNIELYVDTSGTDDFTYNAGIVNAQWYHIAVSYDSSRTNELELYVDGTLVQSWNTPAGALANSLTSPLTLGIARPDAADPWGDFNGRIDDVMIFNDSLSAEQIFAIYNNRTDLIVSQETNIGDTWQCSAKPNDGYVDGLTLFSNNLTIINTPPTHVNPILNATKISNSTYENLTIYNQSTYDLQNDDIKNIINWYKDSKPLQILNMPFEGGSNSTFTKDYSSSSNDGIVNGATWLSTGGHDGFGAYKFGAGNNISFPLSHSSNAFTVAAWVKHDSVPLSIQNYVRTNNEAFVIRHDGVTSQGQLHFYIRTDGTLKHIRVNNTLSVGKWYFIVGTWDGENQSLYINGVLNTTQTPGGTLATTTSGFIGSSTESMDGIIDDIQIYNYSLSAKQIYALYQNRTDVIVDKETKSGEIWQGCITPNDGYEDGIERCSNNITINQEPSITSVTINSTLGLNSSIENITAYSIGLSDPENDAIKNIFNWYKNSQSITVLNMPFDGGSTQYDKYSKQNGSTKDYSPYNNTGIVIGNSTNSGPNWIEGGGHDGYGAYDFDGVDDHIGIIDTSTINLVDVYERTISVWFKADNTVARQVIYEEGGVANGFNIYLDNNNLYFGYYSNSITNTYTSTAFSDTTSWHHAVLVFDGINGDQRMYLDNVLVGISSNLGYIQSHSGNIGIGAKDSSTVYHDGSSAGDGEYFNGRIDDVMIFNDSLSAEQIFAIYNDRTDLIVSQETNIGDTWQCSVTPNDGYNDGNTLSSNNLTIVGIPTLNVWSLSDSQITYSNYTKVFANLSIDSSPLTNAICTLYQNKNGYWKEYGTLAYNATSKLYETIANAGHSKWNTKSLPVGVYDINVSCVSSFRNLSNTSVANISNYTSTLTIQNSTNTSLGDMVYFNATFSGPYGDLGRLIWNTSDFDLDNQTYSLAAVDIDGNGKKDDIVVAAHGILRGYYGNGSLAWTNDLDVDRGLFKIQVADLDNDGYFDEIVVADGTEVSVCGGPDTVKVFDARTGNLIQSNPSTNYCSSILPNVGDFDGDGIVDDLSVIDYIGGLSVYNTSDGSNWNLIFSEAGAGGSSVRILATMDVNDDGIDDVIFRKNSGPVYAYSGNNGSQIWNLSGIVSETRDSAISFGDLNENGKNDVIMFAYFNTVCAVYKNASVFFPCTSPPGSFNIYEIETFDEDGDGLKDDFVFGGESWGVGNNGYIVAYNHDRTQLWSYQLPNLDEGIYSLSVQDINNDGVDEIIAGSDLGWVYVLDIKGNLLFDWNLSLGDIGTYMGKDPSIDISDVNNDGINDFAVASQDGYLHIFQTAYCKADFDDGLSYNLTWNNSANKWQMNRSFNSTGIFNYNITCSKNGYETQIKSSYVNISIDLLALNITSPINGTKYSSNNDSLILNVTTNIEATSLWFYINNDTSTNYTLSKNSTDVWLYDLSSLEPGYYNLSVFGNTSSGTMGNSSVYFYILANVDIKIHKKIKSINTSEYVVILKLENKINDTANLRLIDFVDSNFNYTSFSQMYDSSENFSSGSHIGHILYWNLSIPDNSNLTINYSVLGLGDYNLLENYVAGVESFSSGVSPLTQTQCDALPGEWILVPGSSTYGTSDFCIMKYEAKNVGGIATSQAALSPSLGTWNQATSNCTALGPNYHLVTDNEWLTLAKNLEQVASNWNSSVVGTGYIYLGHSDRSPPSGQPASTNDSDGYYSIFDTSSSCDFGFNGFVASDETTSGRSCQGQRRTLYLQSGKAIWDFSGNVAEWVNDTIDKNLRYHGGDQQTMSYHNDDGTGKIASLVPVLKQPSSTWNAYQGMGRYYDGFNLAGGYNSINEAPDFCTGYCAPFVAYLRGGSFTDGPLCGIYALDLNRGRSYTSNSYQGYRCSYSP